MTEPTAAAPCRNCVDLAETLRRVVANEGNHYDRYWTPPPEPVTDEWLNDTETKMREALTDAFCDDAAAIMLTLIGEVRRLRNARNEGNPLT
jgi:hypothetical protein